MVVLWPFRRGDDYEKELGLLQKKISFYQQKSSSLKLRLRNTKGLVTLYSIVIWILLILFLAIGLLPHNLLFIGSAVSGPVIIHVVRITITRVFEYLIRSSDVHLDVLSIELQEKIEELKQKTNFYSTQALLKRFEHGEPEPEESPENDKQPSSLGQPLEGEELLALQAQLQNPHKFVFEPYQPKWYDKILDLLVGEDETSPKNRYALICENCRNHNGLAQFGESPEHVIYICPHCGFKNGSVKPVSEVPSSEQEVELEFEPENENENESAPEFIEPKSPLQNPQDEQPINREGTAVPEIFDTDIPTLLETTASGTTAKSGSRQRKSNNSKSGSI